MLRQGAQECAPLLQDLSNACYLSRTSSEGAFSELHPLVWDIAERTRRQQPPQTQLHALDAFLRYMLDLGDRLAGMRPGVSSPAQVEEAVQMLEKELPNISALAMQLGQPPLCTLSYGDDTRKRLETMVDTLSTFGQTAVAGQLQAAMQVQQRSGGALRIKQQQWRRQLNQLGGRGVARTS